MINTMQGAIIKKDLRGMISNKQAFLTILIVPLFLTIVLPSIFILGIHFLPNDLEDFEKMLAMLPVGKLTGDLSIDIINLVINNIMPVFFLMIPIMASSVMAASSFVGEKEKRTLETLLYCPLSLKQIFQSKIMASFFMSMLVSFISFFGMLFVTEIEILLVTGSMIMPNISWVIIMFLISPALSLISITLIVHGSAKAQNVEEVQQRVMFLILPVIILVAGQFTGILLVGPFIMLGIGMILAVIAGALMKGLMGKFNYESLSLNKI